VDVRIAIPDRHVSEGVLNAGLEAVTRVNEALIKEGSAPTFTQAIKDGVRWQPEPPGHESFDHALKVSQRGWGDCDDLAPHRAGSLRASGQDPNARAVVYKSGPGRWHAIVQRGDGRLEDPSRTAGMKVREGSRAAGIAPAVVGAMGASTVGGAVRPFVAVRRDDQGYLARVDVPIEGDDGDELLSFVQRGRSPSHALSGCMAGACMVGAASEMVDEEALDNMWALHGLMKGQSLEEVAHVCGAEAAKDALLTLKAIAPDLVDELRKHWDDARVLREDLDRRRKPEAAGAAVLGGRHHHHKHHHPHKRRHHVHGDGGPGADRMGPGEWSSHLAHERVVSPYAERFGQRGRQYVGAATLSPYLEMRMDPSWGTTPRRAFGHEQAFSEEPPIAQVVGWGQPGAEHFGETETEWSDHLAHERVVSPYAERFGQRGRQFVGAGLPFRPTLSFSLAGEHPGQQGYRSSARPPRSAAELHAEIDDLVERALRGVPPGALATAHPDAIADAILSSLRAAPLGRRPRAEERGLASPAQIVHQGNVATAFDRALHAPPIVGWDLFKDVLKPAGDGLAHMVSNATKGIDLGKTISDIGHGVDQLGHVAVDVLKAAQGVISLIPGIGTGISAAISAGLAILSGGGPIDIAVKMAYGAIPIPPGIRNVTDIVVDAALSLVHTQNLADTGIAVLRKATIDKLPSFAQGLAGTVFDTLAHVVLGFVHKAPTTAVVAPAPALGFPPRVAAISTPAHYSVLASIAGNQAVGRPTVASLSATAAANLAAQQAARAKAAAPAPAAPKRVVHMAVKVPPKAPVLMPVKAVAPAIALSMHPAAPIATLSLATIVRTMQPEVIRHNIALPKGVRA
jgi:hypothetical protein